MALQNVKCAWVNRSNSNIPVYEDWVKNGGYAGGHTAGGDQIGTIYPNEFYLLMHL